MNRIQNPKTQIQNLFVCLAFTLLPALPATAAEVKATHRVAEVTVYPDRAVVTRRGSAALPPGEHEILFEGLPIGLDENSIRAGGTGSGWRILGVELKRDYREPTQSPEALKLRDQIRAAEDKKQDLQDERSDLNQKRSLLNELSREASSGKGKDDDDKPVVNVADIQKLVDYYGGELAKISTRLRGIERTERDLNKDLERLRAELSKLENPGTPQNRRVAVTVQADTATTASVDVSYMIHGAGWTPQYDVHASGSDGKVVLTSYGIVRQRTGEIWDEAKLVLSTARPQLGTALPDLNPWIVEILQPLPAAAPAAPPQDQLLRMSKLESRRNVAAQGMKDMAGGRGEFAAEPQAVQLMESTIETRGFSAVYRVPGTTTVPSDGEPHRCTISRQEMTAQLEYTATPKLMPGAYVKAKVKNANPAPLLPGQLNVFMGNDFIGSSGLDLVGPEGVFELFLGKDDGIKVQRKDKVRKEETGGMIHKTRVVRLGATIEVENMKSTPATLTLKDQLPVARQGEIKVRATGLTPKPTKENKETGELQWEIPLKAKEKRTIEIDFEIEAPADLPLQGV